MTFDVDRTTVIEGDIVEVKWDCAGADRVELTIDNGYKATAIPLDINGTKRFRLNRSKGRTALTITAWKGEKHGSKTIKVKVKEMPATHAETVDTQGQPISGLSQWWQRTKLRWQQMPPDKRTASTALLALAVIFLFARVIPALFFLGIAALSGYLLYIILKK